VAVDKSATTDEKTPSCSPANVQKAMVTLYPRVVSEDDHNSLAGFPNSVVLVLKERIY
jgi:hypothetical protein